MSDTDPQQGPLTLLSRLGEQHENAADFAYQHIVSRIREARESVEVHMYVWRSDAVGHWVGESLLEAAERGVKIKIIKDRGAVLFESQESNRKSFFCTPRNHFERLLQRGIGFTFLDSYREDDWDDDLGGKLIKHPNVEFCWVTCTHTKYYCIDERYLITGSLNLEERHRGYHDMMVEVSGEEPIRQFRCVQKGLRHDVGEGNRLGLSVLFNDPLRSNFMIKPTVLELINSARSCIYIEVAYLGDGDVTAALIDAGRRGVRLSILFSEKSNVGNEVNYTVLQELMKRVHVANIDVKLSSKMIHSKLMIIDHSKVLVGSANFSIFSMQRAGELCLLTDDQELVLQVEGVIGERWQMGNPFVCMEGLPRFSSWLASLQQWHQRLSRHQ